MKRPRMSERGMSLLAMLVIVVLVGGIASAFMLLTLTEMRVSEKARYKIRANYLAESAVEQVASLLRTGYANEILLPSQASGVITIQNIPVGYVVTSPSPFDPRVDPRTWLYDLSGTLSINNQNIAFTAKKYAYIPPGGTGGQVSIYRHLFQIEASLTYNAALGYKEILGYVVRDVEMDASPIFQFLAFYNGRLEFLPGPAFAGHGRVHTNGDLFIGGGGALDLSTDHLWARGNMYRHRFDDGSYTENNGPLTIHDPAGTVAAGWAADPTMESFNNPNWGSNSAPLQALGVRSGSTGATEFQSPDMNAVAPSSSSNINGGLFFQKAANASAGSIYGNGLVIQDGNVMTKMSDGTMSIDSAATSALQSAGALKQTSLTDTRQSSTTPVQVTLIDMGKLKTTRFYPSNGVLYAYQSANVDSSGNPIAGTPSNPPQGILVTNGSDLSSPASALPGVPFPGSVTIASNGPVYVQGDFNAPHVLQDPTNPNSIVMDPTTGAPLQDVSKKQGAAIIADAVNLLSNAWDVTNPSYKPTNGLTLPTATATNYNFAMLTGNVPSGMDANGNPTGSYSGGLENLPRFQENWGPTLTNANGVNCNYRGALVNLWPSAVATGVWGQPGVYVPPNRNWDFDQDYLLPGRPQPPIFPMAINIARTVYQETYQDRLSQSQ